MPRPKTTKTRRVAAPPTPEGATPRLPAVMRSAEALSVGAVNTLTGTVVTAIRGLQKVGAEVASTAVSAVRGTIRAAGELGGAAKSSEPGSKTQPADRAGARSTKASVSIPTPRKPLRKAGATAKRRRRRSAA
jgi:hypothetical protein